MARKVISLAFSYARESKKYNVYNLADEHEFFPKTIYISKKDMKEPIKKVSINIIFEEA